MAPTRIILNCHCSMKKSEAVETIELKYSDRMKQLVIENKMLLQENDRLRRTLKKLRNYLTIQYHASAEIKSIIEGLPDLD